MKKILLGIFEPFYYLYQRKLSDKIITFLKRFPIVQYVLAALVTVGILYLVLVGF